MPPWLGVKGLPCCSPFAAPGGWWSAFLRRLLPATFSHLVLKAPTMAQDPFLLDRAVLAAQASLLSQALATAGVCYQQPAGEGFAREGDPVGMRTRLDGTFNLRLVVAAALSAAHVLP